MPGQPQGIPGFWGKSVDFQLSGALSAIAPFDHFKFDRLIILKRSQTGLLDGGDVDKNILATIIRLDKSIAFFGVEPLNSAFSH